MNRKTLLIGFIVTIFFIVFIVPLLLRSSRQLFIPQSSQIPTPIPQNYKERNLTPSPSGSSNISFSVSAGSIIVSFSSSVSASFQSKTTLLSNPALAFTSSWTDAQTLTAQPTSKIDANKQYSLKIVSPVGNATWSVAGSDLLTTTIQQNIQQSQADKSFGQRDQEILNSYPWISDFPVLTDDYFVYFDIQQKQFIAKLYPSTSSSTPYNTQIANFKQEVLSQISLFGINTNQYPISWVIVGK